jgi:cation diffusion facilitator CzcD-associated flavoprotein CzcO
MPSTSAHPRSPSEANLTPDAQPSTEVDVAVIGAGQAGLSSAYFLGRAGFEPGTGFVVLDGDAGPGGAWQHRWPTLRFGAAHRLYPLPAFPLGPVDTDRPAAEVVAEYYGDFEHYYDLPIRRPVRVTAVQPGEHDRLSLVTTSGTWSARAVVNASGTWTKPFWPAYPGGALFQGRQLHTVEYQRPQEFAGRHVVVVGGGNSAVQLLAEISTWTTTTWVSRSEPVWNTGTFDESAGREAIARVEQRVLAGLPPQSVVSVTGLGLTPAVVAAAERGVMVRRPMFERITPTGVQWSNGDFVQADVILWCTGFRAALDHLKPLHLRESGGGIRMQGTRVLADPRIHLVGYGPSASTIGANRAGRVAARELSALLRPKTPDIN